MSTNSSADQLELDGLTTSIKRSTSWFYWIAALSAINTLIIVFGGGVSFIVGLGSTQIIDGLAWGFVEEGAPEYIKYIAMGVSFLVAGFFGVFGFLGQKQFLPIYIIGILLYALDALIFVAFQDWFPVAFHAFALFNLWKAVGDIKAFRQLKESMESAEPEFAAIS